ncbi:MAG: PIF1 helicase [Microgenomates group bacterium GW2011_GWA2_46_7]|nr:MAG: PIF1 helicase [Microgenomates group bacterium GW2011_GWA2_46_7]
MSIDLNPQFLSTLDLLENSSDSLFITGRAGTGKSTLLTYFKSHTKLKVVILAPTGVAAVNIGGATIHSFFGFKPDITLEKAWALGAKTKKATLYCALDAIVIDEISMVRADLLDCIDAFMRRVVGNSHPFGGKRLILFGDLYQLPPVVTRDDKAVFGTRYSTPFFFSADVISRLSLTFVELDHIYRQVDTEFITVLNAIRENMATVDHLALLNTRLNPDYAPPPEEYVVYLTGTNKDAQTYNTYQLNSLDGDSHTFAAVSTGAFDRRTEPAPRELVLKIGAQVMLTSNDREKRFINGTVGRVEDLSMSNGTPVVSVRVRTGKLIDVSPNTWEMYKFNFHAKSGRITTEVAGTYTQLPLMLAWGITIHKAQGKTFDRLAIDLPASFAHGQTYVALSRATSLDSIILKRPLTLRHIIMDPVVTTWLTLMRETSSIL